MKLLTLFKNTFSERFTSWYDKGINLLPNIVMATCIIFGFFILSFFIKKTFRKTLSKATDNAVIVALLSNTVGVVVLFTGVFIALETLYLSKAVTSLLAGAGVVGIALGFAFQDLASNFISGIFLAIKRPMQIGDTVEVENIQGIVKTMDTRTTSLETPTGERVTIPNKSFFSQPLINYTQTTARRVDINIGVSYNTDLELAESVLKNTIENLPVLAENKPIDILFSDFGESSIGVTVRFWCKKSDTYSVLQAKSLAIKNIKNALDKACIEIPYPIRTIVNSTD